MRAITISGHGGLDRLEFRDDLPSPLAGPGQVRVRLRAAALNHLDLFVLRGLPGVTIAPPWIMGADGAGVIDQTGEGVDEAMLGACVMINPGISDGTCEFCIAGEQSLCVNFRLLGEHLPGTLAEHVVVPVSNVRRFDAVEGDPVERFVDAAAFSLASLTAWRMVVTRARVEAGENVLIWGIGGGVALAALQICKLLGARVWVTSSSGEKLARARELGADVTVNHAEEDVARVVRSQTGKRGVEVVIDNVGAATWTKSLGALCKGGRLVTCGATSGPMVETDVRRLFWNQWQILGSTMGSDEEYSAVTDEFNRGRLRPVVDSVFPLERGAEAFARLAEAGQFGKIVVTI